MAEAGRRSEIVAAANELFYRQGFEHTSFANIAAVVGISRGNFYHHFKSKDAILEAVIEQRLEDTRHLLEQWNAEGDTPAARIVCFIRILIANRTQILRSGCPVGTLSAELAKLDHSSLDHANELFAVFRGWLREQFSLLAPQCEADTLALHLLARSQGVATLANAFGDEDFLLREVQQMTDWVSTVGVPVAAAG